MNDDDNNTTKETTMTQPKSFAFYVIDYPEEGCVGPYPSRDEALAAAKEILPGEQCGTVSLTPEQAAFHAEAE